MDTTAIVRKAMEDAAGDSTPKRADPATLLLMRMMVGVPVEKNPSAAAWANVPEPEDTTPIKDAMLRSGNSVIPVEEVETQEEATSPVETAYAQDDAPDDTPPRRAIRHVARRGKRARVPAPAVSRPAVEDEIMRTMLPPSPRKVYGSTRRGEYEEAQDARRGPTGPVADMEWHDTNGDGIGTSDRLVLNDDGTPIKQNALLDAFRRLIGGR